MMASPFRYARVALLLLSSVAVVNMTEAEPAHRWPDKAAGTAAPVYRPLDFDEVTATLPRDLAPVPAVMIAQVNIAMHAARQRAEQNLCAGRWTPRGSKAGEIGPLLPDLRSSPASSAESWIYHSFRTPEKLACGDVTRNQFFQEVSRHLPAWITIRPAAQMITYRQGIAIGTAPAAIIATR